MIALAILINARNMAVLKLSEDSVMQMISAMEICIQNSHGTELKRSVMEMMPVILQCISKIDNLYMYKMSLSSSF